MAGDEEELHFDGRTRQRGPGGCRLHSSHMQSFASGCRRRDESTAAVQAEQPLSMLHSMNLPATGIAMSAEGDGEMSFSPPWCTITPCAGNGLCSCLFDGDTDAERDRHEAHACCWNRG